MRNLGYGYSVVDVYVNASVPDGTVTNVLVVAQLTLRLQELLGWYYHNVRNGRRGKSEVEPTLTVTARMVLPHKILNVVDLQIGIALSCELFL